MHSASTFISAAPFTFHSHFVRPRARRVRLRTPAPASVPGYSYVRHARTPRAILRQENTSDSDFGYTPDTALGVDLRDGEVKKPKPSTPDETARSPALQVPSTTDTATDSVETTIQQIIQNGSRVTEEDTAKEIRIGITMPPGQNSSTDTDAVGAPLDAVKKGVIGLVKESYMTGHLRLPTGKEAALFAWESSIVIALIILLRAGVQTTLKWIHAKLSTARKDQVTYEESVWECMQRPLEAVSVFTVATLLAEAVSRPLAAEGLMRYLRTLRELGFIICAAWFLLRWIERIRIRYNNDKKADKTQVDATSRIATVATTVVSVLVSLDTVGINVQTVLAFGGIGGVAIGFAGREIISNFFGGFMIYITRPFTVGEWVRSIEEAELNGTVEDIGWYLTRVRTWDKRPLYIPNSRFSTLIVENGSRMSNRRIIHTLNLRLEDVPVLPKIVAELTKYLMRHTELDPRQHRMAYVDGFGGYSVQVWLSCYTKSVFLYDFRRVQQEILLNAHEIIRSHGARLATITTRDVRPGVNIDRYGPLGSDASYSTPTNEPKVGETPPQPQFKLADVPGAPFFSQMHVDDHLLNIESGVSEESIAAALRMESPLPLPKEQKPKEPAQPAGTKTSQSQTIQNKQSSEAAVAAAAAALAAARRNQARIEEQNARTRKRSASDAVSKMNISTAPAKPNAGASDNIQADGVKTTEPHSGRTMNISAAPASDSNSLSASTGAEPTSASPSTNTNTSSNGSAIGTKGKSNGSTNEGVGGKSIGVTTTTSSTGNETVAGMESDTSSKNGGSTVATSGRKTGAVSRPTDAVDTDTRMSGDSGRTMKISAVTKTVDSASPVTKEKKAETSNNANSNGNKAKGESGDAAEATIAKEAGRAMKIKSGADASEADVGARNSKSDAQSTPSGERRMKISYVAKEDDGEKPSSDNGPTA